jgi:hypothetical protein
MASSTWRSARTSRISFGADSDLSSFLVQEVCKKGNVDVFVDRTLRFSEAGIYITDVKTPSNVGLLKFVDIESIECNFAQKSYSVVVARKQENSQEVFIFPNIHLRQQFCLIALSKCETIKYMDGRDAFDKGRGVHVHRNAFVSGRPCELHVYAATGILAVKESRSKKMYPLTQKSQMEIVGTKCGINGHSVSLLVGGEQTPLIFTFSSACARDAFINHARIWKYLPDRTALQKEGWRGIGSNYRELRVHTSTFNAAATKPPDDLDKLSPMMPRTGIDIYAVGFQECKYFKEWFSAVERHLSCNDHGRFKTIAAPGMWGIRLFIIVKEELLVHISHITNDIQACGKFDVMGNKGAVGCGFHIFESNSLAFVSSHLAARAERVSSRQKNYKKICSKMNIGGNHDNTDFIHCFDHVFWMGDLNYRVDMGSMGTAREFSKAVALAKQNRHTDLVAFDQLNVTMHSSLGPFSNFEEGNIEFPPTYRLVRGSHLEYSNKRCQNPSYTDRILWKSRPSLQGAVELLNYDADHTALQVSDHRPVFADFTVRTQLPFIRNTSNGVASNGVARNAGAAKQNSPSWIQIEFEDIEFMPTDVVELVDEALELFAGGGDSNDDEQDEAIKFFKSEEDLSELCKVAIDDSSTPSSTFVDTTNADKDTNGVNVPNLSEKEVEWLRQQGGVDYLKTNDLMPRKDGLMRRRSVDLPSHLVKVSSMNIEERSKNEEISSSVRKRGLSSPLIPFRSGGSPGIPCKRDSSRLASVPWLHSRSFKKLRKASLISSVALTKALVQTAQGKKSSRNGKLPPSFHLQFESPILEESSYSAENMDTETWAWQGNLIPILHTYITDIDYISSQHIVVSMGSVNKHGIFTPEHGFAEIPLSIINKDETFQDFHQIVMKDGMYIGNLAGRIKMKFIRGLEDIEKVLGDSEAASVLSNLNLTRSASFRGRPSMRSRTRSGESVAGELSHRFANLSSVTELEDVSEVVDYYVDDDDDDDDVEEDEEEEDAKDAIDSADIKTEGKNSLVTVEEETTEEIPVSKKKIDTADSGTAVGYGVSEPGKDGLGILHQFDRLKLDDKIQALRKMIVSVSSESIADSCLNAIEKCQKDELKEKIMSISGKHRSLRRPPRMSTFERKIKGAVPPPPPGEGAAPPPPQSK